MAASKRTPEQRSKRAAAQRVRSRELKAGRVRPGRRFNRKSLEEALSDHIEFDPNGGCWLWSGCCDQAGNAIVCRGKSRLLARRAAFQIWDPRAADAGQASLVRLCGVKACIRPSHHQPNASETGVERRRKGRPPAQETGLQRLWRSVSVTDCCWLWKGRRNPFGYVHIRYEGRQVFLHRVFYELFVGPIPGNMLVLHRCDVPHCCNPNHLFLGDHAANAADMVAKGRHSNGRHLP